MTRPAWHAARQLRRHRRSGNRAMLRGVLYEEIRQVLRTMRYECYHTPSK